MDTIDLPVLPIESSLREAFGEMKRAGRSAVIGEDESGAWLFRAAWIVWGIAADKQRLAELENRQSVHRVSPSHKTAQAIDFDNPHGTVSAVETLLDSVVRPYLMKASVSFGEMTMIITRHESLKFDFGSGPADCYCTNPNRRDHPHSYSQDDVPDDGKCTRDGSKVVCAP